MRSRITLIAVALLICGTFAKPLTADDAKKKRPNILLIYADDQSYKTISCYGSNPKWVETPEIDAIARRGVRFHRSYLGAWCMSSRASILTGRLQHGVMTMRMVGQYPGSTYDPAKCRFLPSEFRKQGYHTAQIGKWHTGNDSGYGRDWDYQVVWNRPKYPDNAGNYFYNQVIEINGEKQMMKGYSTDEYTIWAVDYIKGENRAEDKPWYLWLCYGAIHGPTTPAPRHKGKLAGNKAPVPADIIGPWPGKPAYLEKTASYVKQDDGTITMKGKRRSTSNFDTIDAGKPYDNWVQQYNECNMGVDEGVGRVMQALRDSGQLENTIVVYTADQGYALGEHGFNAKLAPYDATIASAMIISYPGHVPEGKVCEHPINAPDLVGYLCHMAGVEVPWETHGRDIRPLVENPEKEKWVSPMLFTHTSRSYGEDTFEIPTDERLTAAGNVPWYVMLRDGKLKYVRVLIEGETEELYDLENDPEELTNLANDRRYADKLAELRRKASEQLRQTDAKFVDRMPATKQMLVK